MMKVKLALSALALALVTNGASQAQTGLQTPANPNVLQATPRVAVQDAQKIDKKTAFGQIRASKLTGMAIYNPSGESIGKVEDLVIDWSSGRVAYAAVSYGGFLGLGDKLFAVPWTAFKTEVDPRDNNAQRLVLNVSADRLKNADGFNQEQWPNFAEPGFEERAFKFYGLEWNPNQVRNRGAAGVGVNIGPGGVDVNVDRK